MAYRRSHPKFTPVPKPSPKPPEPTTAPRTFHATLHPAEAATPKGRGTVVSVTKATALAIPKRPDGTRRVWVAIEQLEPYQAKVQGNGRGGYFVAVNQQRVEALAKSFGESNKSRKKKKETRKPDHAEGIFAAKLRVTLTPDLSKYGLPMPVELELLLAEDPVAHDYFEALIPQQQRRILHGVGTPKGEATRLRKAVATVEYLHAVRGKVDIKGWNEALRADA